MMRIKRLIVFLVILSLVAAVTWGVNSKTGKKSSSGLALILDTTSYLWINSILCVVYNNGNFGYDDAGFLGKTDGFYYPFASDKDDKTVIYAAGLWVGAKTQEGTREDTTFGECVEFEGDTCIAYADTTIDTVEVSKIRLAIAEYSSEFTPGPMLDSTFQTDRAGFRVYKLGAGNEVDGTPYDDSDDRAAWPVGDGAPVDENGDPVMLGNQMCWSVCNDADPDKHANMATDPLGIEIQQTTFGFAAKGALDNVIFMKYVIINKGEHVLDSTFISLWADPDVGDASDDFVGCDTMLSLGYAYNEGADGLYGKAVPAVGFDFFQGPIVPSPGDVAILPSGDTIFDHKILPMSSFNKYINGTDPQNFTEAYNYMRGLNRDGTPLIDPTTNQETKFFLPGDPVTGEGWIDEQSDDRRWMETTGPFTMQPGDTQVVIAAALAARGTDALNSITELRRIDAQAQLVYDLNFIIPQPPPNPTVYARGFDEAIELTWDNKPEGPDNYMEDFRKELGQLYVFEGYNVYMGDSPTGPWTRIATFDADASRLQALYEDAAGPYYGCVWDSLAEELVCDTTKVRQWDFQVLYENKPDPATGKMQRVVGQNGSDAGWAYHLRLDRDPRDGTTLINYRPHYFAVTSYGVNIEQVTAADSVFTGPVYEGMLSYSIENRLQSITVIPHGSGATLVDQAAHVSGGSDGSVDIEYLTQDSITGHDYEVTFVEDVPGEVFWRLTDITDNNAIILDNQTNQSGDYDYPQVHGIMVRTQGPQLDVKLIQEVANAEGPISPDYVKYSLNSTGDWYVDAVSHNWAYLNYFEVLGINDYELRFTEGGSGFYNWADDMLYMTEEGEPILCPFEAWNIGIGTPDDETDDVRVNIAVDDRDTSGDWSWSDRVFIIDTPYQDPPPEAGPYIYDENTVIAYFLIVSNESEEDAPDVGTVIRFTSNKPNAVDDVFTFTTKKVGDVDGTVVAKTMDNIKTVPNPYYNYAPYYELNQFDRVLKFINLPPNVEITFRIFNLAGDLVRTIVQPAGEEAEAIWDVKTESGLYVASGIYIYLAESSIGQKVGKMAVFTEIEQLNTY
jgi:hypothetical protein